MAEIKEKTKKPAAEVAQGPQVNGSLPLYADPQAVHSVTHADVAVRVGATDFGFAAKAPLIQLTVEEFERAALDYPVRRQNIWHRSRYKLAEGGPRLGLDFRRRAYGVASADVRWSVA